MNSIVHPESAYESIMHPNVRTNLRNRARGEDAALYTKLYCSKVAGIEGHCEDKCEAHYWAAREDRGGNKSRCHEVQCQTQPRHGDRFAELSLY